MIRKEGSKILLCGFTYGLVILDIFPCWLLIAGIALEIDLDQLGLPFLHGLRKLKILSVHSKLRKI